MRTTLTLDDDVARRIESLRRRRGTTLREIVNEALREGLVRIEAPEPPRTRYATRAVSLGGCRLGDLDDIAGSLAVAETERYR